MNTKKIYKNRGFTIVELLIVIAVIAILAAITSVTYVETQQEARDARRKSDLTIIENAMKAYKMENGDFVTIGSGCGSGGNGNGWYSSPYGAYGTIDDCLVNSGALATSIVDPSGTTACAASSVPCRTYMKYSCGEVTYLMASLESEPSMVDGPTNMTCGSGLTYDTSYGMNYVVKVE